MFVPLCSNVGCGALMVRIGANTVHALYFRFQVETFALCCLPYIMRQLLQQRELTCRRVCGPFMTQLACDPYEKVVLGAQLCGRVCGPMKGLSKSVQCSSVSTTHILYNHALSGGLKLTHTRCTRLIIFNQPEVQCQLRFPDSFDFRTDFRHR